MPFPAAALFPAAPAVSKRFLRILYADDVRELREIVRQFFSLDGHEVECVEDGRIALQRVQADDGFDLVITDHNMPNMTGVELVRALREVNFPAPIMVFSSDLGSAIAAEYERLKVDRILNKPIYPAMLRQVIAELFPSTAGTVELAPSAALTDRPLNRPRPRD